MTACVVRFSHDIEEKRLNIVIQSLVIQEEFGQQTQVLTVNLQKIIRHNTFTNKLISHALSEQRMSADLICLQWCIKKNQTCQMCLLTVKQLKLYINQRFACLLSLFFLHVWKKSWCHTVVNIILHPAFKINNKWTNASWCSLFNSYVAELKKHGLEIGSMCKLYLQK